MEAKLGLLSGRRTQISILLTIIAILLWAHSIITAKFQIGQFGLIHSLQVTFFVALALLTVASAILWVCREKHGKLFLLQLLVLVSALSLIPVVTGGSPPFISRSYFNLGLVNYIAEEGSFSSKQLWYLCWPSTHILFSMMAIVGTINFELLLSTFSFFLIVAYLFPLYIFLKNTLGKERVNYCWAGLWLFCLASWGGGTTTFASSQNNAFFLLLVVLALVTTPSLWERDSPKLPLLSTVGFLTIAIIYPLTY